MFNKKTLCKMVTIGVLIGMAGFVPNTVNMPVVYAEEDALRDYLKKSNAILKIMDEAKKFSSVGNYKRAVEIYTEGLKNYPDSDYLYIQRSSCYSMLKKYDNALADCDRAIEIDPYNLGHYESKARIYDDMEQYDKVVEIYTQLIEKNPYEIEYYRERGNAYYQLKDEQHMTEDYKKYLSMCSKPDEIMAAYADLCTGYYLRGIVYQRIKDYQHAIEDYTKAISFNRSSMMQYLYRCRGECYEALGDTEKAKADFVEAKLHGG